MEQQQIQIQQNEIDKNLDFIRNTPDFPKISSQYVQNQHDQDKINAIKFSKQQKNHLFQVLQNVSKNSDKYSVYYAVCVVNDPHALYKKYHGAMHEIFTQFNLHPPETLNSLYDQLARTPVSSQLHQLLDYYTRDEVNFDEFDNVIYGISDLNSSKGNVTGGKLLSYYENLAVKLSRFYISHSQLQKFYPMSFIDILKYLRIVGLDNANRFLPKIHTGAVQMAKSLDLSVEKLIQYVQAIEKCFGERSSFAESLWFACKKQLIKKYNSYGIFVSLIDVNDIFQSISSIRNKSGSNYSHFVQLSDQILRKCNCFQLNSMCDTCPICLHKKIQKSIFIDFPPSHLSNIVKLFKEISNKERLFYCVSLENLQQIVKSCQIMFKQKNFIEYVLGLDLINNLEFLSHIQDICLQLIQSPYLNDRMKVVSFDRNFVQLLHEFYCLSWIQLFYLQQTHHSKESLSYFLTEQPRISDLASARTDDFQILSK